MLMPVSPGCCGPFAQIPVLKHGISPELLLDNLQPAFVAMDVNEDGVIERKESLKAALSFKKQVGATPCPPLRHRANRRTSWPVMSE